MRSCSRRRRSRSRPGDTLSEIAGAHRLTLAVLLAFPENAKYRANPGLIHPGDVVRVK
jgi:Tfp pilus assembly protein FimV